MRPLMPPDEGNTYECKAILANLGERAVIDHREVIFRGPYEKQRRCFSVEGIYVIYNYLETIGLVNEKHRKEVESVLDDLIEERRNIKHFIRMHDDGERAEQEAEAGPRRLTEPPVGSKYNADSTVPTAANMKNEQAQKELVESLMKTVESLTTKLATADAKNSEYEAERETKRAKKESFSVRELLQDLKLNVAKNHMNRFGSDIKKKFEEKYPERASLTLMKHNTTSFRSEDRVILESLVLSFHREYELRTNGVSEPVVANAGLEGEALAEFVLGKPFRKTTLKNTKFRWRFQHRFKLMLMWIWRSCWEPSAPKKCVGALTRARAPPVSRELSSQRAARQRVDSI